MGDFTELHEWHEFYFLLGTAAAAFIALLFVAISVSAGLLALQLHWPPVAIAGACLTLMPVNIRNAGDRCWR